MRKVLDSFERATEWSDLVQILTKLKSELETVNLFSIDFKDVLAKRLCTS